MVTLRPVALSRLFAVLLRTVTPVTLLFKFVPLAILSVRWGRQHIDIVVVGHVKVSIASQVLGLHDGCHQVETGEGPHLPIISL